MGPWEHASIAGTKGARQHGRGRMYLRCRVAITLERVLLTTVTTRGAYGWFAPDG